MIDLKYYAELLLSKENAVEVLRFYNKKNFKNLNQAQWFFKNQDDQKVEWIKDEKSRKFLPEILKSFGEKLDDAQLSYEDKIKLTLDSCELDQAMFEFLDIKGTRSVTCVCPKCKGLGNGKGKAERAYIPKQGESKAVHCNHRSSCRFYGDLISAYAEEYNIKKGAAMNIIAAELNVDFTQNEVHIGVKEKEIKKPSPTLKPKPVPTPNEIEYMHFDEKRAYRTIEFKDFIKKYDEMSEVQQFKMIATAIYRYSLSTKQWGKEKYFKEIGISLKENPSLGEKVKMIKETLGYLFATDIPELINHLKEFFSINDLVKYGVIHDEKREDGSKNPFAYQFKIDIQEGLIVIPNLDLYTNMCTGIKYRKTKLKSWVEKKNQELIVDKIKEPEFSYGRIANPLPYHLTRESLLNKAVVFRFTEGMKDLHSLPSLPNTCDIAIAGVNGISEEMLGLFSGRIVNIYFDQDVPGQEGAHKLKDNLEKAGAIVINSTWDMKLGDDINAVLQNGNILKIM